MLVEDEPWALIGLEEIIDWEAMGFQIVSRCQCGREALQAADECLPDAVITDIRMPDMTGEELYRQLHSRYPGMVGAVVSAYADFEIAQKAIQLSILSYALKPLNVDEMTDLAHRAEGKTHEPAKSRPARGV